MILRSTILLLVAAFAMLLASGAASAQVEVAPPPRSVLDELAKEYVQLGLPLPPKDAVPVRIAEVVFLDGYEEHRSRLAFRTSDPSRLKQWTYTVFNWDPPFQHTLGVVHPNAVEVLRSDPKLAAEFTRPPVGDLAFMAILFKLRGEHAFADALYSVGIGDGLSRESLSDFLREAAWKHYEGRLLERTRDRGEILKTLSRLIETFPEFQTPENKQLLASLERTVRFTRTAKPGTAESLIDDLMDHWSAEPNERRSNAGREAYWKLTDMGFDAVPALIDHVRDDRLSRSRNKDRDDPHWLTVGHLCCRILHDLSAGTIEGDFSRDGRTRYAAADVRKWFAMAKKTGEEKWLAEHSVHQPGISEFDPERVIRRVLGVKHPQRFLAVLKDAPKGDLFHYVPIASSGLPLKTKIALLKEGAGETDDPERWQMAMYGLAGLDRDEHRGALLATLRKPDLGAAFGAYWFLHQLELADDVDCWKAFASASKRPAAERSDSIRRMGDTPAAFWDWRGRFRTERLRFQSAFLNDDESGPLAAENIAGLLGLPARRDDQGIVWTDDDTGAFRRLLFRARMAAAAELEIERLGKTKP